MPDVEVRRVADQKNSAHAQSVRPAGRSRADARGGPAVSVVLPARDAERTIAQTIRSVLEQTLDDLELIVVDDGSVDGTLTEVRAIPDGRIRVMSSRRRGLGAARNVGLRSAAGDFVAFIDADDLWSPEKLMTHVAALREQKRAVFAYSWTLFIDAQGRYLFAKSPDRVHGDVRNALRKEYFLASGSNLFVRRDTALQVGGFDEHLGAAQDWDFALKLAELGDLALVPGYQVGYRIAEGALSSDAALSATACATVVRRAVDPDSAADQQLPNVSRRRIREYETFLWLTRSPDSDFDRRARRRLVRSVQDDPAWLLSTEPWQLIFAAFACLLVPRRRRRRAVFGLLRVYGRWLRLRHTELRSGLRWLRSSRSNLVGRGAEAPFVLPAAARGTAGRGA